MLRPSIASLLIALSFTAGAASAQSVLVVDDQAGPGVDFTSLGAAVAAAAGGETILVRAGDYVGDLHIDGKSLAIAADPEGATVRFLGTLRVDHLSSGQFVSIAGVHFDRSAAAGWDTAVKVYNNLGAVWFEDCRIDGRDAVLPTDPVGGALDATNSAHVTLVRCELYGGDGRPYDGEWLTGMGTMGMQNFGSNSRLYDSVVWGGSNTCTAEFGCPLSSATGIAVVGGTVMLEGSEVRAGAPGQICPGGSPPCVTGGVGAGIFMYTGEPDVTLFDTTIPVGNPPVHMETIIPPGTLTMVPGSSRDFTVTSPVRTGQPHTLQFTGVAGEQAWVFAGVAAPTAIPAPKFKGTLFVQQPSLLLALGVLPPGGVLALTSNAAAFPAALDSLPVAIQAVFAGGGGVILSDPARMLLVKPGL